MEASSTEVTALAYRVPAVRPPDTRPRRPGGPGTVDRDADPGPFAVVPESAGVDGASRLARNVATYGAGLSVNAAAMVVGLLLLARILGPRSYGVLTLATTVFGLLVSVVFLGGEEAFSRLYFEERTAGARRILTSSWTALLVLWAAVVCGVLSLASGVASRWLTGSTTLMVPFLLILCTVPVVIANRMLGQVLRNQFRPAAAGTLCAIRGVLALGASLFAVVVLRAGVPGAVAGTLVAESCSVAIRLVVVRPGHAVRMDPERLRALLRYGLPFVPTSVAFWVVTVSDRVLLTRMTTLVQVGLYGYANMLVSAGNLFSSAFAQAWSPHIYATVTDDPEGAARQAGKSLTYVLILSGALAVVVSAFAPEIVGALAGGQYALAARAIPPLAMAFVAMATTRITGIGMAVQKRTVATATCSGLAAAVNVVLCLLLIPRHGIVGAAWASTISYCALTGLYLARSQRLWRIPIETRKVVTVAVLVAGSVMASTMVDPRPGFGLCTKSALVLAFPLCLLATRCLGRQDADLVRRLVGARRRARIQPGTGGGASS